jgi:hypothetical protein
MVVWAAGQELGLSSAWDRAVAMQSYLRKPGMNTRLPELCPLEWYP